VGNFLALVAPQCSLAFYATTLYRLFGTAENHLVWWKRIAWGIVTFAAVFIVCGGAYSIGADNTYARAPGFWIIATTAFVMAAVSFMVLLRHRTALPQRTFLVYLLLSVLPMGAAAFQALVYGLNVAAIAHLLCLLALFADCTVTASEDAAEARERAALKDKELAEARLATVTSQIRPHFLFNTLDGIYYLVAEDPARAQEAIDEFSTYLRANLESLEQTAAVPIEKELSHVRTYLDLEKMSMEDLLEFDIDAQAGGFRVPVLSVQTIAENAVKHGVGKKPGGGHVTVRTREDREYYVVEVSDDGVGFDPEAVSGEGHIGLENARTRLDAMCHGELLVESALGEGTTVTMKVPKVEAEELEQ
jgi:signal transduction histidine kinase